MNRRLFIAMSMTLPLLARTALADTPRLMVAKSPTCGCCGAWVDAMRTAGFDVETRDVTQSALWELKERVGITDELSSCHTGMIDGYVIEGHVPAEDISRLLTERPDALGLTVPGMPVGSPGMEMGDTREPFETLLVHTGGRSEVFARHN
ncbi:DUF411 domain-containing protein [Roseovarius sp. 2305UL8-3]|uniref:DUF411 domain-containing protein n=1 Tax=Roseovarius conchicola TaxID=3121636 RepID=UPI0035288775